MTLLSHIPIPALSGAILSSGCGQYPSLEAAKVSVNLTFSFSVRASSQAVFAFGSHRQVCGSPIIRASLLCTRARALGILATIKVHLTI